MPKECSVYIDEAGDLGVNRGTQWFVLTAVIIDSIEEPSIRATMKMIRSRLNKDNIHFREIKDFSKRSFVVRELSKHNFTFTNILFDTTKFDRQKMQNERIAYNYICRYLIERVSWFLRDTDRRGKIVLSSRGNSRDKELIKYISDKLIRYDFNEVENRFSKVMTLQAPEWDMLQLADVCATTTFYAYEKNGYGFTIPCFSKCLKSKLYIHNGKAIPYGIKYFNDSMKPSPEYFAGTQICKLT